MKKLNWLFMIGLVMITLQSNAQITVAWTETNGNIVATNAAGGISFGKYQNGTGTITLEGGCQSEITTSAVSIMEIPDKKTFSVYPNPTEGPLFVDVPKSTQINMYDLTGNLVFMSTTEQINVTNLSSGTYIMVVPGYKSVMFIKF